jgi:succinyl-diaminopimelate desuccinylase
LVDINKMADLLAFLDQNQARFEDDLFDLLRIASVSADSRHRQDVRRAATWVAEHFKQMGLAPEWIETDGHPLIYAETPPVPGAPVALVYGHYDVQPPDPLDEWISPPFEPTRRDGNVYARGATDDKGQMLTHLQSVRAHLATRDKPPIQVKFLIEGEEEIGSVHLEKYLPDHAEKLACECVVISDSCQFAKGTPAITYGLRGIAYYELRLVGPKQDLHSGTFGGAVANPAKVLAQLLASLVDAQGRVTVPHFYDDVKPITDQERALFADLPYDEAAFQRQLGVDGTTGEAGYTSLERRWARPSYDVCGIWGGYQGEGAKTVLPAKAGAKFSFRLVPDQVPAKVTESLRAHLAERIPPGVRWELIDMHGAPGVVIPLDSPCIRAASRAIEGGFGTPPVFIREGGSIPIVSAFAEHLRAETLLLGWGQNDDNTHSPNEKFCLADYHRGIKSSALLWDALAGVRT